jgi:hypothetical protein
MYNPGRRMLACRHHGKEAKTTNYHHLLNDVNARTWYYRFPQASRGIETSHTVSGSGILYNNVEK